jgi:hypothetical protein
MSADRVSVNAFTVHCSSDIDAVRLNPSDGNAMLTTVDSSSTNPEPTAVTRSTQRPTGSDNRTNVMSSHCPGIGREMQQRKLTQSISHRYEWGV